MLTRDKARRLMLAAQGLLTRPRRATRAALLEAIGRMEVLQIDTIHVVARSPYLVLFSRIGPFPNAWLDELLREGRIFECWAHEACFARIEDYALHRANQSQRGGHWAGRRAERMHREHKASLDRLLAHIRENGPVKTSDFDRPREAGGWWGWKDEKRWLEALFATGELMIDRREGFQRVYDLRERVLGKTGTPDLRAEAPLRQLVERSVRALGVAKPRWVADYFRTSKKEVPGVLASLAAEGVLHEVDLEGHRAYVHHDRLPLLEKTPRATYTTLLSPFDPLVWDRARAKELFDFDYRIECYTPAPKRKYGYYVLPILHRGELVGRLDAKAHRAEGRFEVKSLHVEKPADLEEIAAAVQRCADWHGTPEVQVGKSTPRDARKVFSRRPR